MNGTTGLFRLRTRAALCCLGVIAGFGFSGLGSSYASAAEDDAVLQFGRLPASFNGRLTTIETAAAAILRTVSGREVWFDDDGRQHTAAEWFLSEARRGDAPTPKVIRIQNAELLDLVNLEPRTKPGPNQHRYSLDEILPSIEALREARSKAKATGDSESTTARLKTALDELARAYHAAGSVRLSLREPAGTGIEELKEAYLALEQLDSLIIPLVVPPNDAGGRWKSWAQGVVENVIAEAIPDDDRKPHPVVPLLAAVFDARRANDDDRFAKAVAAYAAYLKARPPRAAALDFQVPAGWNEMGTYGGNQAEHFDDTLVEGTTASLLAAHRGTDKFRVNIYYFPTPTAPVEQVVNDWRIGSGLAPLAGDALQKTLTRIRIGSEDGISTDLAYMVQAEPRRLRATLVRRNKDAFVVMCVGSGEAMQAEENRLRAFYESLKFGSPDDARAWFELRNGPPRALAGSSILVAVTEQGSEVRRFRIAGPGPLSEAELAECLKFIEGYTAAETKLPAGWEMLDDTEGPGAEYVFGKGSEVRVVTIRPLAGYGADSELALFNHSRRQLGLSPWKAEELEKQIRTVKFAGGEMRYVELLAEK